MNQLAKGCHRSHPHENMDEACEQRTTIARMQNDMLLDAAHRCIAPACGTACSDCSGALKPAAIFQYAKRYAYLRERHLDAIKAGGVFAGMTPDNVVLNGNDLDAAIDAALALLVNTRANLPATRAKQE